MKEAIILKKIYNKHIRQLKHVNIKNKRLIICFSGVPCSGKTYIAKILEKKCKAIRINTDSIRSIIRKIVKNYSKLSDENYKEKILNNYLVNLLENYPFKNKLIILDKGIDRDYNKIFKIAKKHNFKVFIIRIKSALKIINQRVRIKCKWPDKNFINNINRWKKEFNDFNKKVKADITINNNQNKKPDLSLLFKKLDGII